MYILAEKALPNTVIRGVINGMVSGVALMCGTWAECARYQLAQGLRTTTNIIEL